MNHLSEHRRVGAHLSAAGSYVNAIKNAKEIGADALQIFSGSPRVWVRKAIDEAALQEFFLASQEQDVRPIFVHSLYLVNLASENTELVQKSVKAIVHDLRFGSYFNCAGVVVHLGSHQGRGWESSKEQVALLVQQIIDEASVSTPFLIENSAGQSGKLCSDLSEIRWLLDTVQREQLGWCYDTCHGWAAGYRATEPKNAEHQLFDTLEKYQLWDSLKCIHTNDSRDTYDSGRDRHDNIGEGNIPQAEWQALFAEPRWSHVPLITEAPGFDGNGPDAENIKRIRALL